MSRIASVFATLFVAAALASPVAPVGAATSVDPKLPFTEVTKTFVDTTRPTPAIAGSTVAAAPSRTLITSIWLPAGKGPFPLIVFSHGNGANQPGDVEFVIDKVLALARHKGFLRHKVDARHIGVAGHSLGAITTLGATERSCCRDARVDAAIAISGAPLIEGTDFVGKGPPILLIHGTADPTVPYAGSTISYSRAAPPKYLLSVVGGHHADFLAPTGTPASPDVARVTLDFWDAYLRGDRAARARLPGDSTAGATTMQFDAPAVAAAAAR